MTKQIIIFLSVLFSLQVFGNTIAVKGSISSPIPQDKVESLVVDKPLLDSAGLSEFHPQPKYDPIKTPKELDYYNFQKAKEAIPSYLGLKITQSKRLVVLPDGKIRFHVAPESLTSNIQSLISHTYGQAYFPKKFPQGMRLYNEFYLYGDSVLDIIDQLNEPFSSKYNVHTDVHTNNIISFSYNGAE